MSKAVFEQIKEVLSHVKTQVGLDLTLCADFPGLCLSGDRHYFNVILKDRCSHQNKELAKLRQLSEYSSKISGVEPNGVRRVAVFFALTSTPVIGHMARSPTASNNASWQGCEKRSNLTMDRSG